MPKVITQDRLYSLRDQMLELQEQIAPFLPTSYDLRKVWGMYNSTDVNRYLKKLYEAGLVKFRVSGGSIQYFAVKKEGE